MARQLPGCACCAILIASLALISRAICRATYHNARLTRRHTWRQYRLRLPSWYRYVKACVVAAHTCRLTKYAMNSDLLVIESKILPRGHLCCHNAWKMSSRYFQARPMLLIIPRHLIFLNFRSTCLHIIAGMTWSAVYRALSVTAMIVR